MNDLNALGSWLDSGKSLSVQDGEFVKDSWRVRVKRFFDNTENTSRVSEVTELLLQKLSSLEPSEERVALADLGNKFIKRYSNSKDLQKTMIRVDRALLEYRAEEGYFHPKNSNDFTKWKRYGFPEEVFHQYPEFVQYLLTTPLASQMKVTRDEICVMDDEPKVLVESRWTSRDEIQERFSCEDAPDFNERFFVEKTTRRVFTYLDNGEGLQPHHPFRDVQPKPISRLNDEDYDRTIEMARRFVRIGEEGLTDAEHAELNEDRNFSLQIVSSYVDGPDTNATELLQRRKHPWIRVVCGRDNPELGTQKGDVIEVGFGWSKKPFLPGIALTGRFRNEDLWNYQPAKERVVTNIAITPEEAREIYQYTMRYHADSLNLGRQIGFNLGEQNCSAFVHYAVKAAGVEVPTQSTVNDIIKKVSPNWMKMIWRGAANIKAKTYHRLPSPLKMVAEKVGRFVMKIIDFIFAPLSNFLLFLVGGAFGENGRAFVESEQEDQEMQPPLRIQSMWVNLRNRKLHLPGILQEWQRKQPSTVIYQNPTKLSIVPS